MYEYDHIIDWAQTHQHVADEITLLCDQHHREKTNGLLPRSVVGDANAAPFNLRAGASAPYNLHYSGEQCESAVGSNQVTSSTAADCAAVLVDGVPLVAFRFEDGHYLLNVMLFDEQNELVLRILDNELVYVPTPWDIEFVGTRLIIRSAARNIFIDIKFEPPARVVLDRGRLLLNGVELIIRPDYLLLVNNRGLFRENTAVNVPVTFNLGVDGRDVPSAVRCPAIPRYGVNREEALAWARENVGLSGDDLLSDGPS
ncbi:MAG: HNH endonuclease signature motif containing protein [Egibacteraceae bacterium]